VVYDQVVPLPTAWTRYDTNGSYQTFGGILLVSFVFCDTCDRWLKRFVSYLNWWCCWCDQAAFLNDLVRNGEIADDLAVPTNMKRTTHYSPLLHNVILAIAILNSPETISTDQGDPGTMMSLLASHATSLIETEMFGPMTTTVRGLMLLGSYHFHNLNRHLGWCYAGMGVRVAQARESTLLLALSHSEF